MTRITIALSVLMLQTLLLFMVHPLQTAKPTATTDTGLHFLICNENLSASETGENIVWEKKLAAIFPDLRLLVGASCELSDGTKLIGMIVLEDNQMIVLLDSKNNLLKKTNNLKCPALGDAPYPTFDKLVGHTLYFSCSGADAAIAFKQNYSLNLRTFTYRKLQSVPITASPTLIPSFTPDVNPQVTTTAIDTHARKTGRQLAFVSYRDGDFNIYIMSSDGSDVRPLTTHKAADVSPVWSPDGKQIVFRSLRDGSNAFYLMNSDGSNVRRLTGNEMSVFDPVWSPDGKQIAFRARPLTDGPQLYIMNADGSNVRRLIGINYFFAPVWLPDSKHIAIRTSQDFKEAIYSVNVSDGTLQLLFKDDSIDDAAWSPDGKQVVFVSRREGNNELYLMNADSSDVRRLSNNKASDWSPSWSPDGKQIAFTSDRDSNGDGWDIYVLNLGDGSVRRLTDDGLYNGSPAWQPCQSDC